MTINGRPVAPLICVGAASAAVAAFPISFVRWLPFWAADLLSLPLQGVSFILCGVILLMSGRTTSGQDKGLMLMAFVASGVSVAAALVSIVSANHYIQGSVAH